MSVSVLAWPAVPGSFPRLPVGRQACGAALQSKGTVVPWVHGVTLHWLCCWRREADPGRRGSLLLRPFPSSLDGSRAKEGARQDHGVSPLAQKAREVCTRSSPWDFQEGVLSHSSSLVSLCLLAPHSLSWHCRALISPWCPQVHLFLQKTPPWTVTHFMRCHSLPAHTHILSLEIP